MSESELEEQTVLRSKDVAALTGTTIRALRHYMQVGLLDEPPRDVNGYRRFDVADVVRVLRIRQLADGGVSLERIATILGQNKQLTNEDLDELDQELARKAGRIQAQRDALKRLRDLTRSAPSTPLSRTMQLDDDIHLLVTGTGQIDPDSLDQLRSVVSSVEGLLQPVEWVRRFEELEDQDFIEDREVEALAGSIVEFYRAVTAQIGPVVELEDRTLLSLVDQVRGARLSPAQSRVWALVIESIQS